MILTTASERRDLIDTTTRIALVGASANPTRASFFVFSYLRTRGRYDVRPVNPTITRIGEIDAFADLARYAEHCGAPDLVDVFRKPSEALAVTREAIAVGAKAIWYQYGVIDDEAIALADGAGLAVVVDRCLKVEVARFSGDLSMGGIDGGLISSKRRRR